MIKRDRMATQLADFADRRSYITPDGRHVLYGLDWERQKKLLWERCKGQCEHVFTVSSHNFAQGHDDFAGTRCRRVARHPHHVIKRSTKRNDAMENLLALCERHHIERHPEKQPHWRADALKA
jgi:hypothetical protein